VVTGAENQQSPAAVHCSHAHQALDVVGTARQWERPVLPQIYSPLLPVTDIAL